MKNIDPKKTALLIDGSSFLYRAYYGLRPLHTSKGLPVQAVYSFVRMIKKLIDDFKPTYIAVVWDSKGKTVRHELYEAYKATRQEPPSDLFTQKELIIEFADLIGLTQIAQAGVEADDLMYSLAQDLKKESINTIFITSDKDMGQALDEKVTIFDPFKDQMLNVATFNEKMGFPVEKLPFYFALLGDSSDNIPGVKGIGKKGATDLVTQFTSLEDLYNNLDLVKKESTKKALIENKANAFLSEKLFLLHYYPLNLTKQDIVFDPQNWAKALPLFEELDFKSLIKDVKGTTPLEKKEKLSTLKGYNFKTITTPLELELICSGIKEKKIVALDTELDGLNPLQANTIGLCVGYEKGTAYYIPFGHTTKEPQLSKEHVLNAFKDILADTSIKKIMHHAKFDKLSLWHCGLEEHGLIFDTLIAAHLVSEDWQRIGLKHLSNFYLQEPMLNFQDVVTDLGYKNFAEVPLDLATEYAASDAHQTLQLYPILQEELKKQGMEELYKTIELPLVQVLFDMEREGIYLDTAILAILDQRVSKDLEELRMKIITLLGDAYKDINLNSPKQLAQLLFEDLKLPPQKKTMGKTSFSTDVDVLEALSYLHPIPGLILKYRELFKLKSTYIDPLPSYINKETGRIHSSFSQTAVATGRLASSNPNLQNIPTNTAHYKDIHIRSAFKPKEGNVFLSADYSQIELRVLAYLSQDKALVQAFENNEDIHRATAAKLFDVNFDHVTHEQRQIGKRINFSILYGLTPYGLSQDLKIPFKDAKLYIEKYFAQYPQVSAWMDKVIEETKEHGYVTTYFSRRRYVPGIYESNKNLYDLARRIAINTKAQGTAAELMKLGMVNLDAAFKNNNLEAKILLQIHDELLISVPESQKKETELLVKCILEQVVAWNVPLVVTTRFGADWQDVTK
ncbi:MAG: DNA polymerase I [Candidatus Babeliales bacterium]